MKNTITPPDGVKVVPGPSGPTWMDDGIIISVNDGKTEHTLEHAKAHFKINNTLTNGKPYALLADFTNVKKISREVREYYSIHEVASKHLGVAVISNSPVGRMIANFIFGISKPVVPTKLFPDYESAKKWLQQFI